MAAPVLTAGIDPNCSCDSPASAGCIKKDDNLNINIGVTYATGNNSGGTTTLFILDPDEVILETVLDEPIDGAYNYIENVFFNKYGTWKIIVFSTSIADPLCPNQQCTTETTIIVNVGRPAKIVKNSCKNYSTVGCSWIDTVYRVDVIKVTNGAFEVLSSYIPTVPSDQIDFGFDVPSDGVYVLRIYTNDLLNQYQDFVIYEFCDIIACADSLFNKLICAELCVDCTDPGTVKLLHYYNKFIALFLTTMALITKDHFDSQFKETIDGAKLLSLDEVDKYITRLTDFCYNCINELNFSTPCTNC